MGPDLLVEAQTPEPVDPQNLIKVHVGLLWFGPIRGEPEPVQNPSGVPELSKELDLVFPADGWRCSGVLRDVKDHSVGGNSMIEAGSSLGNAR